jgi:serine phosphatase RsbU (regulator of sigma subunit)
MSRRGAGQPVFPPDAVDRLVSASWRQAWDVSPALILVTFGPTHLLGYQNSAARALVGARTLGRPLGESFPELPAEGLEALTAVMRTGEAMEIPRRRVSLRDRQGGCLDMRFVLVPLGSPPEGVAIMCLNVSAEVRAEHTACRSQLLADISAAVVAAKSPSEGLQSLTDGLVPALADAAAVYVIPDPTWDGSASADAVPPEVLSLIPSLAALGPLPPPAAPDTAAAWGSLLAPGNPLIFPVEESTLPSLAPDPASADWLRAAAVHSIAVVPLVAAGTLTGALVLLAAGARPAFADIDLPFLESVAARAGVAISQVRAALQQRDIALKLQRALLPPTPPSLPGVSVAARYVAGAPEVEVGGDWWDVHDLGGGRIGVGIGDVCGRGIAAAAVMGQARAAMRAAGLAALAPHEVLALLDAQLTEILNGPGADRAGPQFATACYGVVDRARQTVRASTAGHLPPLLLRREGGDVVTTLLPTGPPLGLGQGGYAQAEFPFGPGDMLLMFTDGLVESRTQEVDDGIAALATALQRLAGAESLDEVADGLLHQMVPGAAAGPDDVALVLLRRDDSAEQDRIRASTIPGSQLDAVALGG